MQIVPNTRINPEQIVELLENNGYAPNLRRDVQFRYSYIKDQEHLVILGAKFPVFWPIETDPPVELVTFYPSIAFKPRNGRLSSKFLEITDYLAKNFKKCIENDIKFPHEFNLFGIKTKLKAAFEEYGFIEQTDENDKELSDISDITFRVNVRKKVLSEHETPEFEYHIEQLSQDILRIYKDFHLRPFAGYPPELEEGVAKGRENLTVIFKSENPTQFLIVEPGEINFWCDHQSNNIWIRSGMDALGLNLLYQLMKKRDREDFNLNYLLMDWIIFCRGLIKPLIELVQSEEFDSSELQFFSEIPVIKETLSKKEYPGIFMPTLFYETLTAPDRKKRLSDLYESAPSSLTEVHALDFYSEALYLMRRNEYDAAKGRLMRALKIMSGTHHPLGQLKILLYLSDIAEHEGLYTDAINFLSRAIDLSKSILFPLELLVDMHLKFIRIYASLGRIKDSQKHFLILLKFLQSLQQNNQIKKFIILTHLEMLKIRLNQNKLKIAREHFKTIAKDVHDFPELEFLFYYWRARFEEINGNEKKKIMLLERANSIPQAPLIELIKTKIELGKYYLLKAEKYKDAQKILEKADSMIKEYDLEKLKLKITIKELLIDVNKALNNNEKIRELENELVSLREQLDRFHG